MAGINDNDLDVSMESASEKGGISFCRRKAHRLRPFSRIAGSESCSGISRRSTNSVLKSMLVISSVFSGAAALQSTTRRSGLFHSASRHRTSTSTTTRRMVLTTPESIIEQASTQNLLDDLINESVRTSARRPIMMQFDPSRGWIWKRWKGTVFSETWDSCVKMMIYAMVVTFLCNNYPSIKGSLSGFSVLWAQLLSVTTFTLTFFLNQSYALWRKCYELSRRLQGRLNDLQLTLAAHAARKPGPGPLDPSTYTAASRQILELVSRWVRLFNLLTYGSFTRSHRPVLTPRGMRRLVERGLLTQNEREVLTSSEIPATQRHNAVLMWIARALIEGREAGHFQGGSGFENQFLEKIHVTRAQYGGIGDELQGRMPLAYAHLVQVLVDLVLCMYPFMAFSSGMSGLLTVMGTGLLTLSYQGLFDLAKQFLDPYDNESYGKGEDPLVVDTLIAETNAGSIRWMYGLEQMPVPSQRFRDGELSDCLLPVRGYAVEELGPMEEERLQKERELQEKREREGAEWRKVHEEKEALRKASEAMIEFSMNSPVDNTSSLSNATYVVAKTDVGDILGRSATLASGRAVADILDKVKTLAGGFPDSLIPDFGGSRTSDVEGSATLVNGLAVTEIGDKVATAADEFPGSLIPDATARAEEEERFETEAILDSPPLIETLDATARAEEEERFETEAILDSPPFIETLDATARAEEEERLETEAILNAPPFAETLEPYLEDSMLVAANSTESDDQATGLEMDDLEMDAPFDDTVVNTLDLTTTEDSTSDIIDNVATAADEFPDSLISYLTARAEEKERFKTEAILDSPPFIETLDATARAEEEERFEKEVFLDSPPFIETLDATARAEEEERLETEAILNAPPFAETLEPYMEDSILLASNSTESDDQATGLEMDAFEMDALEMDALEMDAPFADPVANALDLTANEDSTSDHDVEYVEGDIITGSGINGD